MKRRVLFGVYCTLMLWLLFGQRFGFWVQGDYWQQVCANLNLKPLDTVGRYLWVLQNDKGLASMTHAFVNLAGNVAMFVPLGLFLPGLWQKQRQFWLFLLSVFGVILAVELVQLFTLLGKCDVDDVLLNLLGAVFGFAIYRISAKLIEN